MFLLNSRIPLVSFSSKLIVNGTGRESLPKDPDSDANKSLRLRVAINKHPNVHLRLRVPNL